MGRAKLKMELMSNLKTRRSTFVKRKKGLIKKAYELSTLCDVHLCIIIYNPKDMEQPMEPELWPSNPYEICHMIDSYTKRSEQDRSFRTLDLSHFFKDRTKKVEEELSKLRRKNDNETKYPTWDDRFNNFPVEDLNQLSHILESKLEAAKTRLEFIKANQSWEQSTPQNHSSSSYFTQDMFSTRNSMDLKLNHEQQSIRDFDVPLPYYPFDQTQTQTQKGLIPVDSKSIVNPRMMMMMMMDDRYNFTHLGGASSSNVVYAPMEGPIYVDPLVENMMVNNPMATPIRYYTPSMHMMPQYMQYPMMPSASPQVHASKMEHFN